ncbi:MAG: ABC transporter ATP-binding protein [Opitutales bacterium]
MAPDDTNQPPREDPKPMSAGVGEEASNWVVIKRLLRIAFNYRAGCIKILLLQILLLTLGLSGLSFTGLGIDVIRGEINPAFSDVNWPFGLNPSADWSGMKKVWVIASLILSFAITRALLNYTYSVAQGHLVHQQIVLDLREQVYDKLQQLSFRFFDANASGSIINRVTGDVQALRMFIDGVLVQGIIMFLSLAVYMIYMLSLSVPLTLACLATTPLLWLSSVIFSKSVRPAYRQNREIYDRLIRSLSETIQGIQTVKGFGREDRRRDDFLGINEHFQQQQRSIFWKVSLFSPTVGFLTQVNLVVLLGYGGYLVFQGELALGTGLVVFAGLLQQFSGQVSNIANIANTIQRSLTGARRVFEILDTPIEVDSKPDAIPLERAHGAMAFENVGFAYKQIEPTLRDISFSVDAGETVAIVGATGAGKSALMSLIPRFYDVTNGRITLDGHDLRDIHLEDLRRNIGIVFQESFLFSNTVAANIAFGHPHATQAQVENAARIAAADGFIRELENGYDTVLGESGVNLSGGQRQRLAIARAVLLEPPILLLDDPTAAIDPETEHEIMEAMERASRGRTTFIVAHRLSTLRRADKIVVMAEGRVVEVGRHEDLMQRPGLYRRLARLQIVDDISQKAAILREVKPLVEGEIPPRDEGEP